MDVRHAALPAASACLLLSAMLLSACSRKEEAPQAAAPPPTPAATSSAAPASAAGVQAGLDPQAVAALERMSTYLRSLKAFTVHGAATIDMVDENDRKEPIAGTLDYKVAPPDGLQMDVKGPHKRRQLFFDGKKMTLWSPDAKLYATVDAPPTIAGLLARAEDRYGISLPLADLFLWGTEKAPVSAIQSAKVGGHETIDGVGCTRYTFGQPDVEWSVCIQDGNAPLPRQLVIITTDDPARPQYANTLTWNTSPTLPKSDFTFVPPKDAHRIELVERNAEAPATAGGTP